MTRALKLEIEDEAGGVGRVVGDAARPGDQFVLGAGGQVDRDQVRGRARGCRGQGARPRPHRPRTASLPRSATDAASDAAFPAASAIRSGTSAARTSALRIASSRSLGRVAAGARIVSSAAR